MTRKPIHAEPFPGAGHVYEIAIDGIPGTELIVEDYWDRVSGRSWAASQGNPAAMIYAARTAGPASRDVPWDDEVVYGKSNGLGHLVHVSELGEALPEGGER